MHRSRRVAALLAATFILSIAVPAIALATSTLSISGATASFPLVSLLTQRYAKLNKKVKFKLSQGGTQVGINEVAAGRVSIADVSRDPLPADPTGLDFYPIAKYYLCVVTNKSNPLANLTQAQTESIFTGKTTEWSKVPGASASGPIDIISYHYRLDVLARRAAELQQADAELGEVERLLGAADAGVHGQCRSCGAVHSRGAAYCWHCGAPLLHEARPAAAGQAEDKSG